MLPITEHPPLVKKYGQEFKSLFTQPSYNHFLNYLTGLITVPAPNVSKISSWLYQGKDQSSLNRLLTKTDWESSEINTKRLGLLQRNKKTTWKKEGAICIDDTFSEKTGKTMEAVGWYKSHTGEKEYIMAHNFVYSHYVDLDVQYPLDFQVYIKEKDITKQKLSKTFKSKITLAKELVDASEKRGILATLYVFDSWYFAKELTDHIESYGKDWISIAKLNRTVLWNGKKIKLGEFVTKTIPWTSYKRLEVKGKIFWYFTKSVTFKTNGKVRIVSTFEEKEGVLEKYPTVLVTNRTEWDVTKIIKSYMLRWNIETFFRDSKQSLGFEDYQLRSIDAVERHLCLVNLAYSLLELQRIESRLLTKVANQLTTIGDQARSVGNDILRSLVLWVYEQTKKTKNPHHIYQILLS
ncbi:MAG TPA: IS701 family transposase [Candidatus Nitrosotalea sp.]|nr:IS701 family transposase [Candidatus Nitrosotalea sp.]